MTGKYRRRNILKVSSQREGGRRVSKISVLIIREKIINLMLLKI